MGPTVKPLARLEEQRPPEPTPPACKTLEPEKPPKSSSLSSRIREGGDESMARPKKAEAEERSQPNQEIEERKRLKSLAISRNLQSNAPSKPISPLSPSKLILKHQGRDIIKKGQRKNRFLFSFPGLLAPISAGKIGELKDLGTKNPVLYMDFPQVKRQILSFFYFFFNLGIRVLIL